MIKTRVLDSHTASGDYLLQLSFDRVDISLGPHELLKEVRDSLAEKIAGLLFEKIEPKILEILENDNANNKTTACKIET